MNMCDKWDLYQNMIDISGGSPREEALRREKEFLRRKLRNSLSYHEVRIDGVQRNAAVINSDNLNEKTICSLPGEDIPHGGYVEWMDNVWLVTERDANTEVYTRATMIQCNYLLRWIDSDKEIREQWCIIEDGTKYLTGEFEDRQFITTRGDSRIAMTISRNEATAKFDRKCRFLIDDEESGHKLAYTLSKPLKVGHVFNGSGIYKFVLQEVNTSDLDNQELGVADYYRYYPNEENKPGSGGNKPPEPLKPPQENAAGRERKVWL